MRGIYSLHPFLQIPSCEEDYSEELHGTIPCYDFHRKIIALRLYFALIIANFLFITLSTSYYIYRNISANWYTPSSLENTNLPTSNQTVSKQWQIYSLKKRGLFGTIFGAIGHLIFSTTVLLYQVFVTRFTCDIYLWGPVVGFYIWTYAIIWRTFRLHYLIRINELQERYANRKKTISFNTSHNNTENSINKTANDDNKDYIWFIHHKDNVNISGRKQIIPLCVSLVAILSIIILAESLGIWINGISQCEFYMGNYMTLAMVIFFFVIIVPFIFWYLRHDGDAHGIRKEIWVTMGVGVPCFIMCIIWQVLFEYPTDSKPAGLRGVFGPSNWLIIVTTTYHIMSIILPLFKTLSLKPQKNQRNSSANKCGKMCRHRRPSAVSAHTIEAGLHLAHHNDSSTTLHNSVTNSNHHWELTTESLYHALRDPVALDILKNWAVKDFSVENILFYDRYLLLVQLIDQSNSHKEQRNNTLSVEKSSHEQHNISSQESVHSQSIAISKPNEETLNVPIDPDQIPELIDFYNTFIADHSPLQVNISHKARAEVDAVLEPLAKQYKNDSACSILQHTQTTKSGIPYFLKLSMGVEEELDENYGFYTSSFEKYKQATSSSSSSMFLSDALNAKPKYLNEEKPTYSNSKRRNSNGKKPFITPKTHITLQLFETARKEVFWNIFTGLFPKIVEAYNNQCSKQCT